MTDSVAQKIEENLAKERNRKLENDLIANRTWYISCSVFFVLASVGIAYGGFWMIAMVAFILGLIFLSQYIDANGHLHEVQRRSTKTLAPDFSVLRRPDDKTSANAPSASH